MIAASDSAKAPISTLPEHASADDVRALTWVRDEVRRSIEAAQKALQRHMREAEALSGSDVDRVDPAVLRGARTHFHQAAGALELVGLPIPARLLRAAEQAAVRLMERPALLTPQALQAFEGAAKGVGEFLSRLSSGRAVSGLSLFPPLRKLLELAAAARIHPADLWEADWRWRTVARDPNAEPQVADAQTRESMERLILRLMRAPDRFTLRKMSDLCAALGADAKGRSATLWRLASGFFEAQAQGLLRWDVYVKRTAPRLLAVARGGMKAGEATDRLAQDLLFFCARAVDPGAAVSLPRLSAVRLAYGLGTEPITDYEDFSEGRADAAALAQARKRALAAREAWASVAGPEPLRLGAVRESFELLNDSLHALLPNGAELGAALQRVTATLAVKPTLPQAVAMEVATALLALDAAWDEDEGDTVLWGARTRQMAQRIASVLAGGALQPLEPWMEEAYRRSSEPHTVGAVVLELRAALAEVERLVELYFRDTAQRSVLHPVAGLLGHVRGVLSVLGVEPATAATSCVRDDLDQLANSAATGPGAPQRNQDLFDRLAENLGALGFVVDILAVQPMLARLMFSFDVHSQRLVTLMPKRQAEPPFGDSIPDSRVEPVPTEPSAAEVAPADAPTAWPPQLDALADAGVAASVGPAPAAAAVSALAAVALAAERSELSAVPVGAAEPVAPLVAVVAVVAAVAAVAAVADDGPLPAAEPEPPVPSVARAGLSRSVDHGDGDGDGDGEEDMLAVFLEEVDEVLSDARQALVELALPQRDVVQDLPLMTAIRRSFHTLKGSSRMVGLSAFGEAAWACEQLYNARLAQSPQMDAPLAGLTAQLIDYFAQWANAQARRCVQGHRAEPVVRSADAMRQHRQWLLLELPASVAEPPAARAASEPAVIATNQATEPALLEEAVKVVGPLRIDIAMFNIFLNEADELSRRLVACLAEWAVQAQLTRQPPGEEGVVLAHSLAGCSATVGFAELSELARALEHAMLRSQEATRLQGSELALFNTCATEVRRLLHQFAAGFLASAQPGLRASLEGYQPPLPAPAQSPEAAPTLTAVLTPAFAYPAAAPHAVPTLPLSQALPVLRADDDIDLEDSVDAELLSVFIEEAEVHLPQLQSHMRAWTAQPQDREPSAACMRTLHTLKGAARLAGAMRVGELAHRLETAIEQFSAEPLLSAADVESLLWRVDALEASYHAVRDGWAEAADARAAQAASAESPLRRADPLPTPVAEHGATVLDSTDGPAGLAGFASVPEASPESAPIQALNTAPDPESEVLDAQALGIDWTSLVASEQGAPQNGSLSAGPRHHGALAAAFSAVRVRSTLLDRLVNHAGETSIARTRLETDLVQVKTSLADLSDNLERLRRQLRDVEVQAEVQIISRMEAAKAAAVEFDPLEMDRYTRVQELTRMMAESVNDVATVQRSLQRSLQSGEDQVALQGRLLRSLQDDLMRTRMVEFESLSDRLYRVVRQTSRETGKQVRLEIVGGSIEIDRGVLERMTAPFEHLLRNAIAHGVELPLQRLAAGKDAAGHIRIHLAPEGNEVAIEFSDDGGGLNLPLIREQAQRAGLAPQGAAEFSDAALAELIFTPGFSTAAQVTELAGRGVGMDVVRSEVLALGGRIQTQTEAGQGTRFRMVLPLTTAVTQVLMLRCGNLRVAVPSTLVEATRREPASTIEQAYRQGFWALPDEQVPFHWLGALLGAEAAGPAHGRSIPVVLVRSAAQRVAIHVDEVLGNSEVVVKNLGPQLARLPGLAGITLLATGSIAAIYNPVALAACYGQAARQRVEQLLREQPLGAPLVVERAPSEPAPLVLVVDDSLTVRRVTQRLLLREGYRVQTAKDGLEALDCIAQERPRVVLSDIEMPRMDGFDLLRKLRGDPALANLPVIMITSRIAQKHRDFARELGVRHYLGKPYGEDELLTVVARMARPEVKTA